MKTRAHLVTSVAFCERATAPFFSWDLVCIRRMRYKAFSREKTRFGAAFISFLPLIPDQQAPKRFGLGFST